jgi:hypothetical protein
MNHKLADLKCPSEWTCSDCKHYDNGVCEFFPNGAYWYGFCDGYVADELVRGG